MKSLTDTDQRLMLAEVTGDQANAAVATITRYATGRADLLDLLDKIRPAAHAVEESPAGRRAEPRHGISA